MPPSASINFGVELVHLPALLASLFTLVAVAVGPRNFGSFVTMLFSWLAGSAGITPQPLRKECRKPRAGVVENPHGVFPGLRNSSGAHCFLNSTIQSLASLTALETFLEALLADSDSAGVYLPLSEALWDTVQTLNAPSSSRAVHTNTAVIDAFTLALADSSKHMSPARRALSLIRSGQQDAQEMFQCMSQLLAHEEAVVRAAQTREGGLVVHEALKQPTGTHFPMAGLAASRLADLRCGYVEAIRGVPFDALSLNLPMQAACALEDLLAEYTALETIDDAACRRCSLRATLTRLRADVAHLMPADSRSPVSSSRRRRIREAAHRERRLTALLRDGGDLHADPRLADIPLERSGGGSTKQVLIARPPRILGLHINRSAFLPSGTAAKNPCRVVFPETLDLAPFATTGRLETAPRAPLSSARREALEQLAADGTLPHQSLYALASVVVHYGSHASGHYVTFRRAADGWLRASDANVQPVALDDVLAQNPFMLFYERQEAPRAQPPPAHILPAHALLS
ncbi:hypothetical protein E3P99_01492 [Wallemia hederae]|uniref:ubiquitinyl hydrolase 1 n=1 Tax=Wallemia hederae TaxID=1540922 RepID=A0A4T0FUA7_9BASI|nr:hypothetical protein E3P99_01492 [Wallemia hederae]